VAGILAKSLNLKYEDVRARFEPDPETKKLNRYIVLKRKISEDEAEGLETALIKSKIELVRARPNHDKKKLEDLEKAKTLADAGVRGVVFEQDFERIYPVGSLLSHVVGFYGYIPKYDEHGKELKDGTFGGVEGIERSMDQWLTGLDGQRFFQKDANGREMVAYRGAERAPKHGANVRLTIDLAVQQIVEDELEKACKALKPKRATVLMMNPITGEIMAMANRPTYDPNKPKLATPDQKLNWAVSGAYEPGSTFKTITAAGAVNCGNVTMDTKIFCENGKWAYKGGVLKDHHPYGDLTVTQIIAKSSNIGAVKLGLGLGQEKFYTLVRSFGFGTRTGISLPSETRGILHPLNMWTGSSMYHIPMGHEVAASPLQVVTATSVIANGGNLVMPQIVKDISDEDGNILAEYKPQITQVGLIKASTAKSVGAALEMVTSKIGTAIRARVPGFRVAGKTGTAQIFNQETKTYSTEDHIVSFVGYMPAEAPRFCMAVIIDDSAVVNGHGDTGGVLAAPVFSKIAERVAAHLGLQPDPKLLEEELAFRKQQEKEGKL
jgi:cell division protein FtsI/penicillin-binding protein 2